MEKTEYIPRKKPAPWQVWGRLDQKDALRQMDLACALPIAVQGALMPDAHTGYGLPIGGVLAVKNAVIPYAVGVDIACRMRLSILDMPISALQQNKKHFIHALETETCFGVGGSFKGLAQRDHPVLQEDWQATKLLAHIREKAATQLGTSGSGNHFVEFGQCTLFENLLGLRAGTYLSLLSHSGSRGSGSYVADYYSKLAMSLHKNLPKELKHFAWLNMKSEAGIEYWLAMEMMGRYAAANHELIHEHVLRSMGTTVLGFVENHHNFAWKEELKDEEVIVHRKGATPADKGTLGIIPGSMATPGFVVRGKGNAASLFSCSHGAGRRLSRTAALQTFTQKMLDVHLAEQGVELLSAGVDEAPMAYKDIYEVMQAQEDLVEVVARFDPRLVKMALPEQRRRKRKASCESKKSAVNQKSQL